MYFVETRRFTLQDEVMLSCHDSVNMLSLVEGEACVVESLDGSFAPYTVQHIGTPPLLIHAAPPPNRLESHLKLRLIS